ncbi:MAG: hypothetical protein KF744_04070 [Taibaiella sp.]|nr:hypothetical protein [Taibaiella sp.]
MFQKLDVHTSIQNRCPSELYDKVAEYSVFEVVYGMKQSDKLPLCNMGLDSDITGLRYRGLF